jgi:Raf kinase inhibitor-like YbhB/YbcL family protein
VIRRLLTTVAAGALVTAALAGCSDDGRTLAPIQPGQTTTSTTVPPTLANDAPAIFDLVSPEFEDGAAIPVRFSCAGEDISPPLGWTATPAAAELAIVVRDRQAEGFVHWIVTGIDAGVTGFGQGGVPEGAVEQVNSTGVIGWLGPCPPEGTGTHIYDFVLHALAAPVVIDPALPATEAAALVEAASTAQAPLSGTFSSDGETTTSERQPSAGSQSE